MDEIPFLINVTSSNVNAIGFAHGPEEDNPYVGDLYVKFNNGALYVYHDVNITVFEAFQMAPSKGQFVWQELRDQYSYERIQ